MKITPETTSIGFIGTGVMGKSMAGHLLKAGYELHVYNRTKERAQDLIDKGAIWEESPGALSQKCQVIITIVGYPKDVEEIYMGKEGILENAQKGTYLIDMTTSKPSLAKEIHAKAKSLELQALDAPVSGGDLGAKEARLSIMVGGEQDAFDHVFPIFEIMGKNIVLQGNAGSGQYTKMANQISIAAAMISVCEALAYAKKAGLDQKKVLESIGSGAASSWTLNNLGPRIIDGNFAPGFYVKHFIKDMTIAQESSLELGLSNPGLDLAKKMYEDLAAQGGENLGTHALYKLYNQ